MYSENWRFYPESFLIPLLYYFVLLCKSFKDLFSSRFQFWGESGCKGKEFLVYPPNFWRTFSKKSFSMPQSVNHSLASVSIGVPFVLESGCKSRGFLHILQILFPLFLKFFWWFELTRCFTIMLYNIFFGYSKSQINAWAKLYLII